MKQTFRHKSMFPLSYKYCGAEKSAEKLHTVCTKSWFKHHFFLEFLEVCNRMSYNILLVLSLKTDSNNANAHIMNSQELILLELVLLTKSIKTIFNKNFNKWKSKLIKNCLHIFYFLE